MLLSLLATKLAVAEDVPEPAVSSQTAPDKEARPIRTRTQSLRRMFRGPFQSSRLYTMPAADTVGPYILSISGDGSLLQKPGLLTSAGVVAVMETSELVRAE